MIHNPLVAVIRPAARQRPCTACQHRRISPASVLHQCFDDKVAGVREGTDEAAAPQYTAAPVGCQLRLFTPVTPAEVPEMVRALPDKQCLSNPIPTHVLKSSVDILAPFEPAVLLVS